MITIIVEGSPVDITRKLKQIKKIEKAVRKVAKNAIIQVTLDIKQRKSK